MDKLFRLSSAVKHEPRIDKWFEDQKIELSGVARPWFEKLKACGGDVCEVLHDSYPTACVGDAAFGYVGIFKSHVNVGFFYGAELADPRGLLEGAGKCMRHVKLRPGQTIDAAALDALIVAAYSDIKLRQKNERWSSRVLH